VVVTRTRSRVMPGWSAILDAIPHLDHTDSTALPPIAAQLRTFEASVVRSGILSTPPSANHLHRQLNSPGLGPPAHTPGGLVVIAAPCLHRPTRPACTAHPPRTTNRPSPPRPALARSGQKQFILLFILSVFIHGYFIPHCASCLFGP